MLNKITKSDFSGQWLKCNETQVNAIPPLPIYGSKCSPTDMYYFLSRYRTAYLSRMFIMLPPTSLLTYLQKWRQILLNGVDGWSVVISS